LKKVFKIIRSNFISATRFRFAGSGIIQMNQELIPSTRQKINQLTLFHGRLCYNIGNNFVILMDIFSNKEYGISNHNRLGFEINSKRKCLEFLIERNLITKDHKITTLGLTVILSHKLCISIFSVFILSRLYNAQMTIRNDMVFPYPILVQWFESFPSVSHIRKNINDMKQKQILDNNLRYRLTRINSDKLNELKKYDKYLKAISQYVDDTSEKIDELISADPLVIKQRTQNLKLLSVMNFA